MFHAPLFDLPGSDFSLHSGRCRSGGFCIDDLFFIPPKKSRLFKGAPPKYRNYVVLCGSQIPISDLVDLVDLFQGRGGGR